MIVDKPLSELEQYRPALTAQPDFDAFWQKNLAESDAQPLNATFEVYPYPVEQVTVYKVSYDGFGQGTRIAGWYLVPQNSIHRKANGQTPTIVFYHGYSMSKGLPTDYLHWVLQGYNLLTIDTRGQDGDTPDNNAYNGGSVVGYMTKDILDPAN